MQVTHVDFIDSRLSAAFASTSNSLAVANEHGLSDKLNKMREGDYAYLIVSACHMTEVVKYTHTEKLQRTGTLTLHVERGQHGTIATSFPSGSCVRSEVTGSILRELVQQMIKEEHERL